LEDSAEVVIIRSDSYVAIHQSISVRRLVQLLL
jgi:hypothetical protein